MAAFSLWSHTAFLLNLWVSWSPLLTWIVMFHQTWLLDPIPRLMADYSLKAQPSLTKFVPHYSPFLYNFFNLLDLLVNTWLSWAVVFGAFGKCPIVLYLFSFSNNWFVEWKCYFASGDVDIRCSRFPLTFQRFDSRRAYITTVLHSL